MKASLIKKVVDKDKIHREYPFLQKGGEIGKEGDRTKKEDPTNSCTWAGKGWAERTGKKEQERAPQKGKDLGASLRGEAKRHPDEVPTKRVTDSFS